jgi:hypothetical protein
MCGYCCFDASRLGHVDTQAEGYVRAVKGRDDRFDEIQRRAQVCDRDTEPVSH